jgi:hypothetical protein
MRCPKAEALGSLEAKTPIRQILRYCPLDVVGGVVGLT